MALTPEARKLLIQLALLGVTQAVFFFTVKWLIRQMDPAAGKKEKSAVLAAKLLERINKPGLAKIELSEYENIIAADVVDPSDIKVGWGDIGGLDDTIELLKEAVVLPFTRPDIFKKHNELLGPPKGILLFGPPGCGKSLLAKAIAREVCLNFFTLLSLLLCNVPVS